MKQKNLLTKIPMSNNFFPLTADELYKRINKIPKVSLAMLPTWRGALLLQKNRPLSSHRPRRHEG